MVHGVSHLCSRWANRAVLRSHRPCLGSRHQISKALGTSLPRQTLMYADRTCTQTSQHQPAQFLTLRLAGTPTTPATVTVSGSATSLTGGFTLPANAVYTTLSYRLVSLGEDGTGTTPLFGASGWKDLTPAEIDAKTFTIPDPVVVGGTSFPVPTDRYRLEMRASANGDSSIGKPPSQHPGAVLCMPAARAVQAAHCHLPLNVAPIWHNVPPTCHSAAKSSTASAYKGTPAAATAVTATSGATSIQISFNGAGVW